MKILIIDDEINICLTLKGILEDEDYDVEFALNGKEGIEKMQHIVPDVILLDVKMEAQDGIQTLTEIRQIDTAIQVIMISGHSGISEAVQAIKLGAFDFLEKPLSLPKVKLTVRKAFEFRMMQSQFQEMKLTFANQYRIIGESTAIEKVLKTVKKVAATNAKVLIRGESGTGKELIAYAIHQTSDRANNAFVKFNSAAIPNELVESELFGYEKGAFTGAVKSKKGKLEQADGGTLFLDEIGDMSMSAQAKILRVIQEGEFERVGSNVTQKIDARIIAATHKNLEKMVEEGQFREDLFYRLNVVPIHNPALRERIEDIPKLIAYFSKSFASDLKVREKHFSIEVIRELQSWHFSGNIRELRNIIERIYILSESDIISLEDLPTGKKSKETSQFWQITKPLAEKKKEFEKKYLETQLKLFDDSVTKTANALGMHQGNLSRKLKDLNIQPSKED